jgi:type IV pilus assembly protein PilC
MFWPLRISTQELARLCRRLATSLEAGIDVRTVWAREAQRAISPTARSRLRTVSEAVNDGDSLPEALAQTGDFFPEMFREIAQVGDATGHLAESFAQLAEHYEEQLKLRRMLLVASTWPMVELGIALAVIGGLIWAMGFVNSGNREPIDPLGFGLMGTSGLVVYLTILAVIGSAVFFVIQAIARGLVWTRPIQRFLLRLPGLGGALQTVALSRLAWAMHVTLEAGMDVRQALRLSLRSTRNARYTDHIKSVDATIQAGDPIYEAFDETGAFPFHFLDALRVGEQSGRLVESMAVLSRQYREQAESAFRTLTILAGWAIYMLVAAIIIFFIFRLAMFYIGTLTSI